MKYDRDEERLVTIPHEFLEERLANDSRNDSRRTLELLEERLATIPAKYDSRRSDPEIARKKRSDAQNTLWGRRKRIGRGFNVCTRTYTKPMGKDCRYSKGTQMREIAEQKNGAFYVVKYCDLGVWTRACVLRIRIGRCDQNKLLTCAGYVYQTPCHSPCRRSECLSLCVFPPKPMGRYCKNRAKIELMLKVNRRVDI